LVALEKMEKQGLVVLPAKRDRKQRKIKSVVLTSASEPAERIECELSALGQVHLELVTEKADVALWKELIDRSTTSDITIPSALR